MNPEIASVPMQSYIYRMRGQHVMLDSDLAYLYGTPLKRLNEQVRRNIKRFPPDFMFQLSLPELQSLRSHFATLAKGSRGEHRKYRPYAFTEEGVSMLSAVLRSDRAIRVSIAIMRAFVRLRHAMTSSREVARRVEKLEGKVAVHETDIRLILEDVTRLKKRLNPDKPIPPGILE